MHARKTEQVTLFFYGTLKRGHANHERFCGGALRVEKAAVRGRLYHLAAGYPALVVPEKDVRIAGTGNPARDALEQRRLNELETPEPRGPFVHGELFTFEDPEQRLPAIDHLESFYARGPSLYRRVLIPARTSAGATLAWTYVVDEEPPGLYLADGVWPP